MRDGSDRRRPGSADLKQGVSQRRKEAGCELAPSASLLGCCSNCSVLLRCKVLQQLKQQYFAHDVVASHQLAIAALAWHYLL